MKYIYIFNTLPVIQYNNKKLNRGQLLWPGACMSINKVSDDEICQWNGHEYRVYAPGMECTGSNLSRWDFFIKHFVCCMTHEEKLCVQWPCSSGWVQLEVTDA